MPTVHDLVTGKGFHNRFPDIGGKPDQEKRAAAEYVAGLIAEAARRLRWFTPNLVLAGGISYLLGDHLAEAFRPKLADRGVNRVWVTGLGRNIGVLGAARVAAIGMEQAQTLESSHGSLTR